MKRICLLIGIVFFYSLTGYGQSKNKDIVANKKGIICLKKKDFRCAENFFLSAIEKNSSIKYYYNNLGIALLNQKKYSLAKKYFLKAIEIDSRYAKALSNLAITYFYLSKYIKAYKYYKIAERCDGKYVSNRFPQKKVVKKIEKISNTKDSPKLKTVLKMLKK